MSICSLFDLQGKVALVTGCGRGIGKALTCALAQAGADIVGVGSSASAEETKNAVEELGRKFVYIQADLSSTEGIPHIIKIAKDTFGRIDILVNNAGIIKRNDAIEFTEEEWDAVMNVNIRTLFFLSQAVAKVFIAQGSGGKIINIGSMLSFQGGIRVPSYTASKSGVKGVTMALANEWATAGINVNAIAPGYMATDNTAQLRSDEKRSADILERIPAGRWGAPEDLQGAVIFLASRASDYVHGITLPVDGGWLSR